MSSYDYIYIAIHIFNYILIFHEVYKKKSQNHDKERKSTERQNSKT